MIQIGMVGCGNIGEVHAQVLSKIKEVNILGFADLSMKRAEEYSNRFTEGKANAYDSLETMLALEKLDVLHICTPHNCHVPMAITALKNGIHVFMEKPPAICREEFKRLAEAARQSKGRLGICFQNRYNEATKKVDGILKQGSLGKVRGGRAFVTWNRTDPYYQESPWRGRLNDAGGGVLINQAIHTLDLIIFWLGIPVRTEATMRQHHLKENIEVEDTVEAYMVFTEEETPVSVSFYATTAYAMDAPVFIEFVCERGFVRLEGDRVCYQTQEDKEPKIWVAGKNLMYGKDYWGSGHEACIRDFYDCLETGKEYRNSLASVQNTFETMMDIYDDARKERR